MVVAVVAVLGYRARPGASAGTGISSLAVLPFENASQRGDTDFLVDGITEGLINALARLPDMRVVARTTAFAYKGKPLDLDHVRRELAVDAVLTGRVTERDGRLAVQADLIDPRTGAQLWGSRYSTSDPIAIERAIVTDIGERLRGELTRDQQARLGGRPTGSSEAYRLYLRGRYEWNKRRRQELQTARDYFQQAIDLDPAFALAYVGLADTYILMGGAFRLLPQPEALARADAAARRALEIDPGLAAAHASLGLIQANQFRWKSAERELRAALDLDPNYATARGWYSLVLKTVGRRDEALEQVKKAQALDPLSPLLASNVATLLNLAGDYEGAIAAGQKALELNPQFAYGLWTIGMAYESQGRYATAADFYRRMEGLSGPPNLARALLGRMQAKLGQTAEARRVARELEEVWPSGEVAPTHIAWVHAGLRQNDRAFHWLERALASRDIALRDSLQTIHLAELRDDPRFAGLRHRMLSVEE
jgi:TolB-like protein/Tfp pilus assembly protein PilF